VRKLLKDRFGVEYSEDQVVKILKDFKMNHAKPYPHDYGV
jgi:transposase